MPRSLPKDLSTQQRQPRLSSGTTLQEFDQGERAAHAAEGANAERTAGGRGVQNREAGPQFRLAEDRIATTTPPKTPQRDTGTQGHELHLDFNRYTGTQIQEEIHLRYVDQISNCLDYFYFFKLPQQSQIPLSYYEMKI